jgi:hypothetical protein
MNKYQAIQVHEKPGMLADNISQETEAGRLRIQGKPRYISGVCLKIFLNQEAEAHTYNSS